MVNRLIPCHYNGWLPAFLLTQGFQIAATGGFSAMPTDPAHTVSGIAFSSAGYTRSHHRLLVPSWAEL
jgi:hypothetical protein